MKLNLLHMDGNEFYYSDRDEAKPEIYRMVVTPEMIQDVNQGFTGDSLRKATVGQFASTLIAYHRLQAEKLPTPDVFRLAENPIHASFVLAVYEGRAVA